MQNQKKFLLVSISIILEIGYSSAQDTTYSYVNTSSSTTLFRSLISNTTSKPVTNSPDEPRGMISDMKPQLWKNDAIGQIIGTKLMDIAPISHQGSQNSEAPLLLLSAIPPSRISGTSNAVLEFDLLPDKLNDVSNVHLMILAGGDITIRMTDPPSSYRRWNEILVAAAAINEGKPRTVKFNVSSDTPGALNPEYLERSLLIIQHNRRDYVAKNEPINRTLAVGFEPDQFQFNNTFEIGNTSDAILSSDVKTTPDSMEEESKHVIHNQTSTELLDVVINSSREIVTSKIATNFEKDDDESGSSVRSDDDSQEDPAVVGGPHGSVQNNSHHLLMQLVRQSVMKVMNENKIEQHE